MKAAPHGWVPGAVVSSPVPEEVLPVCLVTSRGTWLLVWCLLCARHSDMSQKRWVGIPSYLGKDSQAPVAASLGLRRPGRASRPSLGREKTIPGKSHLRGARGLAELCQDGKKCNGPEATRVCLRVEAPGVGRWCSVGCW